MIKRWMVAALLLSGTGVAQESRMILQNIATGGIDLPPNTAATDLPIVLEEGAAGGGTIEVSTRDIAVQVALVMPSGVEVGATNAAGLGFGYQRFDLRGQQPSVDFMLGNSVLTHFILPPGLPAGQYKLRASTVGVPNPTALIFSYRPSAGVRIGLSTNASSYRPNSPVRFSGLLFSAAGPPVSGATMQVQLHRIIDLAASDMAATSLSLVSRTPQSGGKDEVLYRVTIANLRATAVRAAMGYCSAATSAQATVEVQRCTAAIGDLAGNAAMTTSDFDLVFWVATGASVSLSQLTWRFEAVAEPLSLTLVDSGPHDPVAGNGSYLAEVSSLTPGRYRAILTASGSVPATGNSFQRQASTEFAVLAAAGTISSAQSQLVDTNSNGLFDLLRVTFPVSIPVQGQYELSAELVAPNGRVFQVVTQVDLVSGQQSVVADVPARDLFALGADGPLSIRNVFLDALLDERLNHQSAASLGSTVPYLRSALDLGVAYISGLASAVGIDSNGVSGFELLRARLSVTSQTADCSWRAELSAQDGTRLGFARSSGRLTAGSNTVDLDFDGGEIRRANKDGPYRLVRASIECSGSDPFQAGELATGPFTASQFENVSAGFSLTGEVSSISITPGRYAGVAFQLSKVGTFQDPIILSIAGLPSSILVSGLDGPVWAPAVVAIDFEATSAAVPGAYPLTVTATGGGLTRTVPLTLTVSSALIAVRVTPSNITMNRNETQQFSVVVTGAPTTGVVWSLEPTVGTLSSTGLYTAPANIAASQPINVVARSVHDATKVAYARVNLTASPVAIALDPPSATMLPSQVLAFTATVQNAANQSVNWTLSPSVGSITPAGVYTAPATIASIQTVTITATSAADPAKTAVATITLKPAFTPIRINAAASNYTDSEGRLWQADTGFTGGGGSLGGGIVRGTYDPSLYLSARTGTFSYDFTVPPGNYAVTLRFAETNIFAGPGFRRFNVAINNVPVEQNLDVFAAAGGGLRALDRTYTQMASGPLSIQFSPGAAQVPMVSAIEIAAAPTSPAQIAVTPANAILVPGETRQFTATVTGATNPRIMWTLTPAVGSISTAGLYTAPATMTSSTEVKIRAVSVEDGLKYGESSVVVGPAEFSPTRLRAGSTAAYTDTAGQVWSADTRYRGGSPGFTWTAAAGAPDPNVYQHWRQDHFRYDFFGPAGSYLVKLRFREPGIFAGPGSRRFPIFVNDTAIEPLPGFDIFTAAGGTNKAVDRQYWVPAPQGKLGIRFDYVGNDAAMVSAIEVTDGYSIAGRVTVNGAGLPNTTISLTGAEARTTFTDADGYYRFRALRPGADYIVTASRLLYTITSGPVNITNLQANQTANFTAMLASANLTPAFVSFTATPTTGWFSTWTANFSDANHANDIVQGELHWGFIPGSPDRACHVRWNLITGEASLRADSGAWLPAIDMYNPQGSLSNSTCTVHSPSSNSAAANQRGFTIGVSFANRMAGEGYPISVKATDLSGASTGWVPAGGWALPQQ